MRQQFLRLLRIIQAFERYKRKARQQQQQGTVKLLLQYIQWGVAHSFSPRLVSGRLTVDCCWCFYSIMWLAPPNSRDCIPSLSLSLSISQFYKCNRPCIIIIRQGGQRLFFHSLSARPMVAAAATAAAFILILFCKTCLFFYYHHLWLWRTLGRIYQGKKKKKRKRICLELLFVVGGKIRPFRRSPPLFYKLFLI